MTSHTPSSRVGLRGDPGATVCKMSTMVTAPVRVPLGKRAQAKWLHGELIQERSYKGDRRAENLNGKDEGSQGSEAVRHCYFPRAGERRERVCYQELELCSAGAGIMEETWPLLGDTT